jgi:hypothetical protein
MSKNYNVWLKGKENVQVRNTSHGTVNTKIATPNIPKVFRRISVVKNVVVCADV